MTGSISMRHSDRAANDIHEGGIVQSAPLSLQHTAVHNNYHIPTPDQLSMAILGNWMKCPLKAHFFVHTVFAMLYGPYTLQCPV